MYDSNTEKAKVLKEYSAARWKDLTAPVQENKPTGLKPAVSFQGIVNMQIAIIIFQIIVTNHILCENNFGFQ